MRLRVRHAWWYRTLTALFGVWLMAATTELISTHSCPMHDGLVPTEGEHAAHAQMAHAQMAHSHMAHAQMSHAMDAHSMDASMTDASMMDASMMHDAVPTTHQMPVGHVCVCIDTCNAASTLMPVAATVSDIVETLLETARVETIARLSPRVSWIDFFIPFSTAPPMTVRA